eukprot:180396-Lingulodinium_polyedra.AAC.1
MARPIRSRTRAVSPEHAQSEPLRVLTTGNLSKARSTSGWMARAVTVKHRCVAKESPAAWPAAGRKQ